MIVSRDKLPYNNNATSLAANLLETKILLKSTISYGQKEIRFMCLDIKDYFLVTPINKPEYMKVKFKYILEDINKIHNLYSKVTKDNYIYMKI